MDTISLTPTSMYAATPIYGLPDGTLVPGLIRDALEPDPTDQVYVVTQAVANRLETIAASFYNEPNAWWVLAQVNEVRDPLCDVPAGTRLRIPARSRLLAANLLPS